MDSPTCANAYNNKQQKKNRVKSICPYAHYKQDAPHAIP